VLFSQGFDGFLLRKTCGAGGRSDEAGRSFVYDLGAGCFDAMTHGETRDIVAFTKDRDFLTFKHPLHLSRFSIGICLENEGYSIVEFG
jgi:hypothetical protein